MPVCRRSAREKAVSAALPAWLATPSLAPVWQRLAERLERGGLQPVGRTRVPGLDREARHALAALLGRPFVQDEVTLDLAELDASLRTRTEVGGLVACVEAAMSRPLADRAAARRERRERREAPVAAVEEELAMTGREGWEDEWLEGLLASGLLARFAAGNQFLVWALRIVRATGGTGWARTELAATVTGDAHALDAGTLLSVVVLRALAAKHGREVAVSTSDRRALWALAEVESDLVSGTCLTLGLVAPGTPLGERLDSARRAGDPAHLTAWDLQRSGHALTCPADRVLVCENPRVLEAVAQRFGAEIPVVCGMGSPTLLVLEVLRRLAAEAQLDYHGDFDWPGLAIAQRLRTTIGVRPWRMSAADYSHAPERGAPLSGQVVQVDWDDELPVIMQERGTAVHEESVLPALLDALEAERDPCRE